MNPPTPDAVRPVLEVRHAGASAVIVQHVPEDKVERFMQLQAGITEAARDFPGYQKVDIYPPTQNQHLEWVVVIHFDDSTTLQRWLESPVRAEWIAKFHGEIGESRLKPLPSGFSSWFVGMDADGKLPPSWKMALSVLLALYPTVMLLAILVVPRPDRLGLAVTMLISNILSVSLTQWIVSPAVNAVLAPWLRADGKEGRRRTLVGLLLILVTLGAMAFLFHTITG
ncbi:MAG: hypothetical protein K2R98_26360 [Gemmataceae bacterium]|nr:hypothetical protein [Gemmataceae bacterium]